MRSGEGQEQAENDSLKMSGVGVSHFHISALWPGEICTQGIVDITGQAPRNFVNLARKQALSSSSQGRTYILCYPRK